MAALIFWLALSALPKRSMGAQKSLPWCVRPSRPTGIHVYPLPSRRKRVHVVSADQDFLHRRLQMRCAFSKSVEPVLSTHSVSGWHAATRGALY